MMKLFTKENIYLAEKMSNDSGTGYEDLMENAGRSSADYIAKSFPSAENKNILIISGKGNNGGDGLVIARILSESGYSVNVFLSAEPATPESRLNLERIRGTKVNIIDNINLLQNYINEADIIVDAIFGIGFSEEIGSEYIRLFDSINNSRAKIISIDLPSGIDSDTGFAARGAIKADVTLALAGYKPSHFIYPAASNCGKRVLLDIGIDAGILDRIESKLFLIDEEPVSGMLKPRIQDSHKGSFGSMLFVGGRAGMSGAAALACQGALRTGVGLVRLAVTQRVMELLAPSLYEPVFHTLTEDSTGGISAASSGYIISLADDSNAVVAGCGMGVTEDSRKIIEDLITNISCPVVLDADGINCLSLNINILKAVIERSKQFKKPKEIILTPHPKEFARLCNVETEKIMANRVKYAAEFAAEYGVYLVLKGAGTIIADPSGRLYINQTGNSGLSKGGSGDLLAGMIGSFAAQGFTPLDSCILGVYLHGMAGELCSRRLSERGMQPSDMLYDLSVLLKKYESSR